MDTIISTIKWVVAHWEEIIALYGAIVAVATTIVKWTPSQKDDTVLAKIIAFLDNFSTAFKKSDAEKFEKLNSGEYRLTKVSTKKTS